MILVVVVLGAAACGSDDGAVGGGDELVVGLLAEPDGMDNLIDEGGTDLTIPNVFEPLVRYTVDGDLEPVLAAALPEQSAEDPLRWRVSLREGVTFTNGEPFDAEAVAANVERLLTDPEVQAEAALVAELASLESVEVIDDYTVELVTNRPDPELDRRLTIFRIGPPVAMAEEGFRRNPVGTGPYMLESWERGTGYTLVANPEYWGEAPAIGTVRIRFIPEESTRIAALESGEIQLAQAIPPDQAARAPQVLRSPGIVQSMILRLTTEGDDPGPMADPNFRRALNYGVNKQAIVDAIFDGAYQVSQCQVGGENTTGYNPQLEGYDYDPDRARELLGQVDISDGYTITLAMSQAGSSPREREVMQAVQSDLQTLGLNIEVPQLDATAYGDAIRQVGNLPDGLLLTPDDSWGSVQRTIENYYHSDGAFSSLAPDHPEFNSLIDESTTATDTEQLATQIQQINQIACDEALLLYLFDMPDFMGAAENVGYTHPAVGDFSTMQLSRVSLN